jgi:hypothetical protein
MADPPPETASQAAGGPAGQPLPPAASRAARAPPTPRLAKAHRLALEKEFVHRWITNDGAYDHVAAAADGYAALAAAASQRLPAPNTAGPITADLAARWAVAAIPPLLPGARQRKSQLRCKHIRAEATKAADDLKPSREALELLMHEGIMPVTVAALWDEARELNAGGGAGGAGDRAGAGGRKGPPRAGAAAAGASRVADIQIPLKLLGDLILVSDPTDPPQILRGRGQGSCSS